MKSKKPLVSILIYNYNYGKYLSECFESAVNQSYENTEILFSDNSSSDNSWNIACEYAKKYPEKITITKNRKNYGGAANLINCALNIRGKYFIILCSDDKIHANYLKFTIQILESNLDSGLLIANRSIINEENEVSQEAPFYKVNCKIPPPLQSEVYMMASINPSLTQVVYRSCYAKNINEIIKFGSRYHANRMLDFMISCESSIIYVTDPYVFHRQHSENDSIGATEKLIEIIGPYLLNLEFIEIARQHDLDEVQDRWDSSVKKLSELSLRYSISALKNKNTRLSKRYFYLALALHPEINVNPIFKEIENFLLNPQQNNQALEEFISKNSGIGRNLSYDPPQGSILLPQNDVPN
jgi:glycosyltransferase involved in cell wall biosynthesis